MVDNSESESARLVTGLELGAGIYYPIDPTGSSCSIESILCFRSLIFFSEFRIPAFDTPMSFDDFIRIRLELDSPDGGLTTAQFREFIGKCRGCERFMLLRSKDHHRCPGKFSLPNLVSDDRLLCLLDSTSGGQGITLNQFEHLFVLCPLCDRVFTQTSASRHLHIDTDNGIGSGAEDDEE